MSRHTTEPSLKKAGSEDLAMHQGEAGYTYSEPHTPAQAPSLSERVTFHVSRDIIRCQGLNHQCCRLWLPPNTHCTWPSFLHRVNLHIPTSAMPNKSNQHCLITKPDIINSLTGNLQIQNSSHFTTFGTTVTDTNWAFKHCKIINHGIFYNAHWAF